MGIKKLKSWLTLTLILVTLLALVGPAAGASAAGADNNGLGRYIVVFDTGVNGAAKDALTRQFGGVTEKEIALLGNANVVLLPQRAVQAFGANAKVLRIEEDAIAYAVGKPTPPPPSEKLPWGVDQIDADRAWATTNGTGVKVAIIDTGIDLDHPDLRANIKGGINIINPAKTADDDNGHGTHVAGIVAAVNNEIGVIGVAPEASLYAVKVLNRNGSGFFSDIILGIQWAIDNDMQVINMSLGSSSGSTSLEQAVNDAYGAGIVIVAAAGNSGPGDNTVLYPAKYSNVIAVSATSSTDSIASFSSIGPEVAVAAPGAGIYSTYKGGGYATLSGTSMASPHVAGTVALIRASHPTLTPGEVRSLLQSTADDLGSGGFDNSYGYGLVDAEQAATGNETLP